MAGTGGAVGVSVAGAILAALAAVVAAAAAVTGGAAVGVGAAGAAGAAGVMTPKSKNCSSPPATRFKFSKEVYILIFILNEVGTDLERWWQTGINFDKYEEIPVGASVYTICLCIMLCLF